MKPYLTDNSRGWPKYKAQRFKGMPGTAKAVSQFEKLTTKNANRARKKAVRQLVRKQLKKL